MNKALSRLKELSQRAAELKAAIQQVPPKVLEVRETLAATTGQLLQLKGEFRQSLAGLRTESESGLGEAIREINAAAEVFAEAGYLISGVDLELSPAQRVLVRLAKVDDVALRELSSLVMAHRSQRVVHAVLSALLQAEQMAETVQVPGLEYSDLVVGIGMMPSVRMGWRDTAAASSALAAAMKPALLPVSTPSPGPAQAMPGMFGAGSFFERRTPEPSSGPAALPAESTPILTPTPKPASLSPAQASSRPPSADTREDPLARFKRMPNLSKHAT